MGVFHRVADRASCVLTSRVSLVTMRGLVAELPVIISAIAFDMNAADTVPKLKSILIFTGGSLAAAPACGLQQGIVRNSRSLIE